MPTRSITSSLSPSDAKRRIGLGTWALGLGIWFITLAPATGPTTPTTTAPATIRPPVARLPNPLAMKVPELEEELEARGEGRTGNKALLRRGLHLMLAHRITAHATTVSQDPRNLALQHRPVSSGPNAGRRALTLGHLETPPSRPTPRGSRDQVAPAAVPQDVGPNMPGKLLRFASGVA